MSFLSGLLATAKKDVSQLPGNLLDHISHPAPGGQVTSPQNNPLSVGRVWGAAVANNAAQQQQFTEPFKNTVMNARPFVGQGNSALSMPSSGGEFDPRTNQISLRSDQLSPYTVTHEGLHAAFERKSPIGQLRFQALANKEPSLNRVNDYMDTKPELYQGQHPVTEQHSYLPLQDDLSPQVQQYYKHFFGNSNFWQPETTQYQIKRKTTYRQPRFSDQLGDK